VANNYNHPCQYTPEFVKASRAAYSLEMKEMGSPVIFSVAAMKLEVRWRLEEQGYPYLVWVVMNIG
jgi:hypothetical protein